MKNFVMLYKYILRLGFIASIILASYLGCAPAPLAPPFQTTTSSNPKITRLVELETTQEKILTLSPLSTLLPLSPLPSQIQKLATPSLSVIPTKPLQALVPAQDLIPEIMEQVNIERAMNDLRRLTGEEPICLDGRCNTITNRETESEGLGWAKEYVYNELAGLGYLVEIQDWSFGSRADQNLVARKTGILYPDEEIYFIAHLDGVQIGPAADDDGSGVVDLLELARVLRPYIFGRTVVLFFSTGEEQGALGVRAYLDQLSSEELAAIQYVVTLDMVGYDANDDGVMELWSGDHPPSLVFTQLLDEIINTYELNLAPRLVSGCT